MRVAQLQILVDHDKLENIQKLDEKMNTLRDEHVDLVTVGEMFNCPYNSKNFPEYAEPDGGEVWRMLSGLARKYGVYLSAGSVPERDENGSIYNTAYVFDRNGKQIAKHRKLHLFDISVPGGQHFFESETLSKGDHYTVFDTEYGKIGLCICFDFRFPELARSMVLDGAKILLVPAAFNMTTGPAHWEITLRARAIDNQCFVVATSPARDATGIYVAWGHSMIVSPWGTIIREARESEEVIVEEIDLAQVERIRQQLPLLDARRTDIYKNA